MSNHVLSQMFPDRAMKLLELANGGYELLLVHANEAIKRPAAVLTVATVHPVAIAGDTTQDIKTRTLCHANCLAAAFLMVHAIDVQLEVIQPEGWDDAMLGVAGANAWRQLLRSFLTACGSGQSPAMRMYRAAPDPEEEAHVALQTLLRNQPEPEEDSG